MAEATWRRATTSHFVIYSEDEPADLKAFAEKLERFDSAVRTARDMGSSNPVPAAKVTVFAVRDVDQLQKLLGQRGGVAGFYIPRHEGSVTFVPRDTYGYRISPEVVFFHEYSHHLMLQRSDEALPAWLIEGFAEFFSTAQFEPDGQVGFGKSATHRADTFRYLSPVPLRTLLGKMNWKDGEMVQSLYAKGWLLTHFLAFNEDRKGQLGKYLDLRRSGISDPMAAEQAFGDLNKLDNELASYLSKRRLPYVTVAAEKIKVANIDIVELPPSQQAMMPVYMMSKRGVTKKTAPGVAAEARAVAARFPTDPLVLLELAEAEFDARNYAASLAASERAIAADPKRIKGHLYKARSILATAKTPDQFTAARTAVAAANRIDPDHPEPLVLFYDSYLKQGLEPSVNALDGLFFAQREVPQDTSLRWRVVRAYINTNKAKEAARALAPIVQSPHGGSKEKLSELLTVLGAGDLAGARKLISTEKELSKLDNSGEEEDGEEKK